MSKWSVYIIMLLAGIIQLSLSHLFRFYNVSVDFLLVFTIFFTYLNKETLHIIVAAIIASIIVDIPTSQITLISGIFLTLVWFLVIKYKDKVNAENKLSIIPISIIGTILYNSLLLITKEILGIPICINIAIYNIGIETILNTIFIFTLYLIFAKRVFAKNRRKRIDVI